LIRELIKAGKHYQQTNKNKKAIAKKGEIHNGNISIRIPHPYGELAESNHRGNHRGVRSHLHHGNFEKGGTWQDQEQTASQGCPCIFVTCPDIPCHSVIFCR
jgi:hypothetical protein